MQTIWKLVLDNSDTQVMPVGSTLLSVHEQNESICLWVLVDPTKPTEERRFAVYGTGQPIPQKKQGFIGTVHMMQGKLVLHVFEIFK